MNEKFKEQREHFKRHRVSKYVAEYMVRGATRLLGVVSQDIRKIRDPAVMSGLIEGAIIGSGVLCPIEDSDQVTYEKAGAGRFAAYDLRRPAEFPKAHKEGRLRLQREGRLMVFNLDSVQDNPADERTPVGALDHLNIDHFFSLDRTNPAELMERDMVAPTTYEEAYQAAGLYDRYGEDLVRRNTTEEEIYMVTPKGNTLIVLMRDGGDSQPKRDLEPAFDEVPSGIRMA